MLVGSLVSKRQVVTASSLCRFCVVIKKENYPDQQPAKRVSGSAKQICRQPGHTIYLLPTMVLANLLPCDLNFYIKGTSIKGSLKPGKEAVLHAADTSQNMELGQDLINISHVFISWILLLFMTCCSSGVLLENFPMCKELLIPPGTQNYVVRMRLYDTNKHLLCLTIRIILRAQGALKILISAPYWLINKTGTQRKPHTSFLWEQALSFHSVTKDQFLFQVCRWSSVRTMEKLMQPDSLRSMSWLEAWVHYSSVTPTKSSLPCECVVNLHMM